MQGYRGGGRRALTEWDLTTIHGQKKKHTQDTTPSLTYPRCRPWSNGHVHFLSMYQYGLSLGSLGPAFISIVCGTLFSLRILMPDAVPVYTVKTTRRSAGPDTRAVEHVLPGSQAANDTLIDGAWHAVWAPASGCLAIEELLSITPLLACTRRPELSRSPVDDDVPPTTSQTPPVRG